MGIKLDKAVLPLDYDTYVFDLYGTLVDISTDENDVEVWKKLALFYGYYGATYTPEELQKEYQSLVEGKEHKLKSHLENDPKYAHEASPEIEITEVFSELFAKKGITVNTELAVHTGQFFRILTTDHVNTYPGTIAMLQELRRHHKKIYLLSNAQRIFTEYEMNTLGILEYFDDVLISSDYQTKKPDERFFRILLEKHDFPVKKALFVGNDAKNDIAGAMRVGMNTFYVNSNISPENDSATNADYYVDAFDAWYINKKGVIFDLDGTLWDSAQAVVDSWNLALDKMKDVDYHMTVEKMQGYMGKTMNEIAFAFFDRETHEKALELLEICMEEENEYIRKHGGILFDGLENMLETLKKDYFLAIVSNCQTGYIEAFLEYHHLEKYFDDIECFGHTKMDKSYNIRLVVERNHLHQVVYVGDTMGDYKSTMDARLPFIHAAYGFGTVPKGTLAAESLLDIPQKVGEVFENEAG